ncbi:MAG: radical SAM protein [bacterium]|nr:radical SAM protein [bacterium]
MLSPKVTAHYQSVLHHLYINPLEKCNLRCKICYTRKTSPILSNEQILDFIFRYEQVQRVETVTFCGGEVFALPQFPALVNAVVAKDIFVQVITNGTLDRLDEINNPNAVSLIVSLDGLETYHDANRGAGNFAKSIACMQKAHKLGFHLEVFSIVTQQNLQNIDAFEANLTEFLGFLPSVTYHPRKPPAYLTHHPVSNIVGETIGFDFLSPDEMIKVMSERNVFPPKDLGCYQVAVTSDGKVYGCCEGTLPIGSISDDPRLLIEKLKERLETWQKTNTLKNCLGCSQSDFMCGIKTYLEKMQELSA